MRVRSHLLVLRSCLQLHSSLDDLPGAPDCQHVQDAAGSKSSWLCLESHSSSRRTIDTRCPSGEYCPKCRQANSIMLAASEKILPLCAVCKGKGTPVDLKEDLGGLHPGPIFLPAPRTSIQGVSMVGRLLDSVGSGHGGPSGQSPSAVVLVVGGSGYLGQQLVQQLLTQGWKVRRDAGPPPPVLCGTGRVAAGAPLSWAALLLSARPSWPT